MSSNNHEVTRLFEIPSFNKGFIMFQSVRNGVLQSFTGSQIDMHSTALASKFIREGVKQGERIITVLKDGPLWNTVECAVLKAGAIHVPLPISVSEGKLTAVIKMTKPVNLLVDSAIQLKRIQSLGASLVKGITISMVNERGLNSTKVDLEALKLRTESIEPQDTAVILFTSGSSGAPKGVLLSHRSILVAAEEFGHSDVFNGVHRSLSVLPMSHSAARKVNYACQLRDITVCYSAPTLSLFRNLQLFEVHHVALVPFLLQKLQEEIIGNTKPVKLKTVTCGGAPLSAEIWKWFDAIGIKVYEVYGLTETASLLSYSTDACRRPDCVGHKAKNVEIEIVNNGELAVKGPTMFKGYLLQDGSIQKPGGKGGWVRTGDCVKIDSDGGLRIIGRTVRSYKSQRGNHIHPEDLERELKSVDGVQEAFIIDEPNERLQGVIVPSKAASLNSVKESLRMHNHSSNEDLQIWRFAILERTAYARLQATGVIKPDSLTFNKLLKQLDFIEL